MAPITWRNVDAPDFRTAMFGVSQASQQLDQAASGIKALMDEGRRINDANWNNQARINTEDVIAQLQGMDNLKKYHTDEALFTASGLRPQVGAQINMDQVDAAKAAQLSKLRDAATGEAILAGKTAAKDSGLVSTGSDAFTDTLRNLGMLETEISKREGNFINNDLAATKAGWGETERQIYNQFGSELMNNPGNIAAITDRYQKQYGPRFTQDMLQMAQGMKANQLKDELLKAQIAESRARTGQLTAKPDDWSVKFDPTGDRFAYMDKNGNTAEFLTRTGLWKELEAQVRKEAKEKGDKLFGLMPNPSEKDIQEEVMNRYVVRWNGQEDTMHTLFGQKHIPQYLDANKLRGDALFNSIFPDEDNDKPEPTENTLPRTIPLNRSRRGNNPGAAIPGPLTGFKIATERARYNNGLISKAELDERIKLIKGE